MMSPDGAALPPAGPDSIHYPDLAIPEPGELRAVQEGLWWLRMPLPISLDHINLWLLEEPGGCALVVNVRSLPTVVPSVELATTR